MAEGRRLPESRSVGSGFGKPLNRERTGKELGRDRDRPANFKRNFFGKIGLFG